MKKLTYAIIGLALVLCSCTKLDVPPKNKVSDESLFSNVAGMRIELATLYSYMPWEDFKYIALRGIDFNSWPGGFCVEGTGEAVSREALDDICSAFTKEKTAWWGQAYKLIHKANYLIEKFPSYKDNFTAVQYDEFLGQGYFVRAFCYMQMARRFGGVPLVTEVIDYPAPEGTTIEKYRSSEKDTWDQILADFDMAISLLQPVPTFNGTASKYAALIFKAEAMLYAGSVAKYNEQVVGRLTGIGEKSGNRVIGFASDEWQECSNKYFAEAYKAAREVMESGRFSLYKKSWKPNDPKAQYQNMVDMWRDLSSSENILVREYEYPTLTHGIDAYCSPYLFRSPLSAGSCPTLDFIELFDGFERYGDGVSIRVTDGTGPDNGHYLMYDNPLDFFANAEPRLRAYVIFPFDEFKGEVIDVRTGIYTGPAPVSPLIGDYSYANSTMRYQNLDMAKDGPGKTLFLCSRPTSTELVEVNGELWNAASRNGIFYLDGEATCTGLYLRKYLDPERKLEDIGEGKSDQPFILARYADALLAAAEAGVELSIAGVASPVEGDDMLQVATDALNEIRERAGAVLYEGKLAADNDSRDIVRKERRKELAFDQKSKWDIRRWRVIDEDNRDGFWGIQRPSSIFSNGVNYRFRGLYPFYSTATGKYFFDPAFHQVNPKTFTYRALDYYFAIPSGEVSKSEYIDQQPNR